jgi:hypothetical protein
VFRFPNNLAYSSRTSCSSGDRLSSPSDICEAPKFCSGVSDAMLALFSSFFSSSEPRRSCAVALMLCRQGNGCCSGVVVDRLRCVDVGFWGYVKPFEGVWVAGRIWWVLEMSTRCFPMLVASSRCCCSNSKSRIDTRVFPATSDWSKCPHHTLGNITSQWLDSSDGRIRAIY